MNLVVKIPDDIAARLGTNGSELERQALEALVLEKFRGGFLSKDELAQVLGFEGRDQLDGFFKVHGVYEPCSVDDVHEDVAAVARLGL